ncbi:MAG TPA: DUF423 domain-containing protein [Acetobacteraceae bacterium]|jgi:uncharacterized membrane protein YgdD (TMEM256/DUF423 family)|nr:DUF423 domain-containing protein [Acetobacteraceae bacterium]
MARVWMVLGALSGLVAVGMAAWASHGVPPEVGARAMTGASLQAWHALALLGTGLLAERRPGRRLPHAAAALFVLGSVLFCGGVYSRAFLDLSWGALTPLGGTLLMAGWGVLAASAIPRP